MPTNVNWDGTTYAYPDPSDEGWGDVATETMLAASQATLQHVGGSFILTAEVDFGPDFGLKTLYIEGQSDNPASSGTVRLSRVDTINWRNEANDDNHTLSVDSDGNLQFDGSSIQTTLVTVTDTDTVDLSISSGQISADVKAGSITSSLITDGTLVDADVSSSAALSRSKIATGTADRLVVNDSSGNLSDAAAITASRALESDANGIPTDSSVTSTELGYVSGVTSAIQTQIDGKVAKAGDTMTGLLTLSGPPSTTNQAATKGYVDSVATGLEVLESVVVATTANVDISNDLENGDTIDGVVIQTGDRVLVKDQSDQTANGVYVAASTGAASRSSDADTFSELVGALVFVTSGTDNQNTQWSSQAEAGGSIGANAIPFAQFGASTSYTADGQGIELSGTQFSIELDGSRITKSSAGLKIPDTLALDSLTASGISVTDSSSEATPTVTITLDNSDATSNALKVTNNTNFAQAGDLIDLSLVNATDSGDVIKINQTGSGKDISGTSDTWSISKAGVIAAPTGNFTTSLTISGSPVSVGGDGGTPGGSDTQVQFNDGGSFGGDSGLTYNKATDSITIGGGLTAAVSSNQDVNIGNSSTGDIAIGNSSTGDIAIGDTSIGSITLGSSNIGGVSVGVGSTGDVLVEGVYSTIISQAGTGSTLTVSSIPAYDYLEVECELLINDSTGAEDIRMTFNNDSGSNYGYRTETAGVSAVGGVGFIKINDYSAGTYDRSVIRMKITNRSAIQKIVTGRGTASLDGGTSSPGYIEIDGVWNNTAARISSIQLSITNSSTFQSGSRIIVRGVNFPS